MTHSLCGQKNNLSKTPPGIPTQKELKAEERNHHCVKKTNTPFKTRLKHYPFNISTQIQLVSFPGGVDTSKWKDMTNIDSLPRLNDTVCYAKLKEVKALTLSQIDKLTDIFYNYGFGGHVHIGYIRCFRPRNAILFLDNSGRLVEYIEVCFECNNTKESSQKISLGQMCTEKMSMLRDYFKHVGITYGLKNEVEE